MYLTTASIAQMIDIRAVRADSSDRKIAEVVACAKKGLQRPASGSQPASCKHLSRDCSIHSGDRHASARSGGGLGAFRRDSNSRRLPVYLQASQYLSNLFCQRSSHCLEAAHGLFRGEAVP